MRKVIIVFAMLGLFSMESQAAFHISDPETTCPVPASLETEAEAKVVIESILDVIGLCPNFEIKEGEVKNATARIMDKKRYILYNPEFITRIRKAGKTDWAAFSILAHELGHHLNGHTITPGGSKPVLELEADEFSGFVLRKMGASLEEAQAAVRVVSSEKGSKTHPPRGQRLKAVKKGWLKADRQISGISYQ